MAKHHIALLLLLALMVGTAGCTAAVFGGQDYWVEAGQSIEISGTVELQPSYWTEVLGWSPDEGIHFWLWTGESGTASWDKIYLGYAAYTPGDYFDWSFTFGAPDANTIETPGSGWEFQYTEWWSGLNVYNHRTAASIGVSTIGPSQTSAGYIHDTYGQDMQLSIVIHCKISPYSERLSQDSALQVSASPSMDLTRIDYQIGSSRIIAGYAPLEINIPKSSYQQPSDYVSVSIWALSPGGWEGQASAQIGPGSRDNPVHLDLKQVVPATTYTTLPPCSHCTSSTTATTPPGSTTPGATTTAGGTTTTAAPWPGVLLSLAALLAIAGYVRRNT